MSERAKKPNCCQEGGKNIWWIIGEDAGSFTGWAIMVDHEPFGDWGISALFQAFYCPFCGEKLEVIND